MQSYGLEQADGMTEGWTERQKKWHTELCVLPKKKLRAKTYRPISLLLLIPKVKENSIHHPTQDDLQRN